MRALVQDEPAELIVNIRNGTAIPQLPADAVVEIPARVSGEGVSALPVGTPAPHQLGLMSQVKGTEQDAIAAVVHGDRSLAARAFALHPLIDSAHTAQRLLRGYENAFPALRDLWR